MYNFELQWDAAATLEEHRRADPICMTAIPLLAQQVFAVDRFEIELRVKVFQSKTKQLQSLLPENC